jgi:hypothetical protein
MEVRIELDPDFSTEYFVNEAFKLKIWKQITTVHETYDNRTIFTRKSIM